MSQSLSWPILLVAMAGSTVSAAPPMAAAAKVIRQQSEQFDSQPKHWEGKSNRVQVKPNPVQQDFGYSATSHAGGKKVGEVGGRIQRCTTPAFYVLPFDKPKSLDQPLHCSGTFTVTQTMGSSSFYFGWCNTKTMESRPRNYLGMLINGEGKGCEIHLSYKTVGGQSDGFRATGTGPKGAKVRDFNLIPPGTPYTWDLKYDPDANGGTGVITFQLGGKGPFTGGPFVFKLTPEQRKSGATFDAFGMVNAQSAGNWLSIYFDDLKIDGRDESFDSETKWTGQGNRDKVDDYGLEGAHQFGFSDTSFAGGKQGEIGGILYSSPDVPGFYAAPVGALNLEDKLVASGKVALRQYGSDGGVYLGWFDSRKRGYPPANILGILIDGPTSTGPRFQGCIASADPKLAHCQRDAAPLIAPDGKPHTWKIEFDSKAADGLGRVTVWLDEQKTSFDLSPELRKRGASFDRFGLFVHEGGGRASQVYLDDLEFSSTAP